MRKLLGVVFLLLALPFALGMLHRLAVFGLALYTILTGSVPSSPEAEGRLMAELTIAGIFGLLMWSCLAVGRRFFKEREEAEEED